MSEHLPAADGECRHRENHQAVLLCFVAHQYNTCRTRMFLWDAWISMNESKKMPQIVDIRSSWNPYLHVVNPLRRMEVYQCRTAVEFASHFKYLKVRLSLKPCRGKQSAGIWVVFWAQWSFCLHLSSYLDYSCKLYFLPCSLNCRVSLAYRSRFRTSNLPRWEWPFP